MHLIDAFPRSGCGIGDDGCTVSLTSTIALRFDRFLNPNTVNRQALQVYAGDPNTSPSIPYVVDYDPVERVAEFRVPPGYGYLPNTLYHVKLVVPESDTDFGIRAFDGAPLEAGEVPLHASFITGDEPTPAVAETHPSCADVADHVFSELGGCASPACHRPSTPRADFGGAPYGLWLDNAPNFAQTTLGRVARETEVGDFSGGTPVERAERFGVRMALVDPGNPGNSYLLYKLLRNPANYAACDSEPGAPPEQKPLYCRGEADPRVSTHALLPLPKHHTVRPSDEELERLSDWFVRGDPMPVIGNGIGLAGLRAVSSFIAGDADDCGN